MMDQTTKTYIRKLKNRMDERDIVEITDGLKQKGNYLYDVSEVSEDGLMSFLAYATLLGYKIKKS